MVQVADPELILRMTNITKRFPGVLANDRISFELRRGEIHALLGENGAGKTTLMRVLFGILRPEEGEVEVAHRAVTIPHPKVALELGIGMVHQHFMLVPNMTVAENIALVTPRAGSFGSPIRLLAKRVGELAERFRFTVRPDQMVGDLSLGQRQQVEILKLLYRGAKILILDEPTASLTPVEWARLSDVLRTLAAAGSSIIFITHKLGELIGLADRCTVLRDGRVIGTVDVRDADEASLARMMVGRDVVLRVERPPLQPGKSLLEVQGLSLEGPDSRLQLQGIDFAVREREILGIAGVEGNGQAQLVEVLTGLRHPTSGRILIDGEGMERLSTRAFITRGTAVIPEDRQRTGLALDLNVGDNLIMKEAHTPRFSRRGFLLLGTADRYSARLVSAFDIRIPARTVLMRQLSGGNQQKAVLARELSRSPKVLIAAQPTRGLDVGAMEFVYGQILAHREHGGATLLISNELDEILSLSDRIAVMVGGRFVRILEAPEVTLEKLGLLMAGSEAP
jgi:simple sugar transport system ATP-binding protein